MKNETQNFKLKKMEREKRREGGREKEKRKKKKGGKSEWEREEEEREKWEPSIYFDRNSEKNYQKFIKKLLEF